MFLKSLVGASFDRAEILFQYLPEQWWKWTLVHVFKKVPENVIYLSWEELTRRWERTVLAFGIEVYR